jgi:GLPGLI family protein
MKSLYLVITMLFFYNYTNAQQFVNKAEIEFEVNTNLKKNMGNNSWDEMMKENLSELKTSYWTYSFTNNKSLFKFNRWSEKTRIPKYIKDQDEEKSWYYDFDTNTMSSLKQVVGSNIVISDSIAPIEWKITNENREIAGYNCRKAVGKIFGDVYVFAFYTDDILITGGPCSINGLPGMILGLTIPRLYTSYVATKVNLSVSNPSEIKPITAKKMYSNLEYRKLIEDKTKDWWSYENDEEEKKREKNVFLWNAFL